MRTSQSRRSQKFLTGGCFFHRRESLRDDIVPSDVTRQAFAPLPSKAAV
jgi:hypothetical protein